MDGFLTAGTGLATIAVVWLAVELGANHGALFVHGVVGSRLWRQRDAVRIAAFLVVIAGALAGSRGVGLEAIQPLLSPVPMLASVLGSIIATALALMVLTLYGLPAPWTALWAGALVGAALGVGVGEGMVPWMALLGTVGVTVLALVLAVCVSWLLIGQRERGEPMLYLAAGVAFAAYLMPFGEAFHLSPLAALAVSSGLIALAVAWPQRADIASRLTLVGAMTLALAVGQRDGAELAYLAAQALGTAWALSPEGGWVLGMAAGGLLALGLLTRRSRRVTRGLMNMASGHTKVRHYTPAWALRAGEKLFERYRPGERLSNARNAKGKKIHFRPDRAVIVAAVAAGLLALCDAVGWPASASAAIVGALIGSGIGGGAFRRRGGASKWARSLWVLTVMAIAVVAVGALAAFFAAVLAATQVFGLLMVTALVLFAGAFIAPHAADHEDRYHYRDWGGSIPEPTPLDVPSPVPTLAATAPTRPRQMPPGAAKVPPPAPPQPVRELPSPPSAGDRARE